MSAMVVVTGSCREIKLGDAEKIFVFITRIPFFYQDTTFLANGKGWMRYIIKIRVEETMSFSCWFEING